MDCIKDSRKKEQIIDRGKKVLLTILIFAIALLGIGAFISCATDEIKLDQVKEALKKGEPEVIDAVTCKNVDSNYGPIDITDVFPAGTNSIYLSVKFKDFTVSDHLSVIWTYIDTKKELSAQSFTPSESGSGYHSFNINIATAFPTGNYAAELKFNSKIFKTLYFSVEQ